VITAPHLTGLKTRVLMYTAKWLNAF
jgi:hypothetical protein